MDDLFKNIKDNLDNRDEPSFNKGAWKDMEKRLDRKPWMGFGTVGWALPLALGLLFLSNIFFFKKLNDANEKISKIELKADTIHQTKYIYQYDTIYRQSVEKQYVVMTQPRVDFYPLQAFNRNAPGFYSSSNKVDFAPIQLTFADLKNMFDEEIGASDAFEKPRLSGIPYIGSNFRLLDENSNYPELSYLSPPAIVKKKKRPFQKLAADVQPIDFQVGVIGGLAYPLHEQVAETSGFAFGIHSAMTFSEKIRMWAEVSYYKVEFKSDVMGEGLGIPEIPVPDDYDFVEASVNQPFYQYVFGLQYIFNTKNDWNPYFGIGYTFASMRSYEVSYDFENDVDGFELSIEEMNDRSDLITNMVLFNAGVEGKLSKHIGLQLEGYYRWDGNKNGLLITDMLGIRSKLVYNF